MNEMILSRKKKKYLLIGIVAGCFLLVMAALYSFQEYRINQDANLSQDILSISNTELESRRYYAIEDMLIIDACATYSKDDEITKVYYLVGFWDKEDVFSTAMLELDRQDSVYDALWEYAQDNSADVGECFLSGYFYLKNISDHTIRDYYRESVELYEDLFSEEDLITEYQLTYISKDSSAAFRQELRKQNQNILYVVLLLALFEVIFFFVARAQLKKLAVTLETVQAANHQATNPSAENSAEGICCSNCGARLEKNALFCMSCGRAVDTINTINSYSGVFDSAKTAVENQENLSRRELFMKVMSANQKKSFTVLMVARYVGCAASVLMLIPNGGFTIWLIIELCIFLGITLGIHLKINKVCAILAIIWSSIGVVYSMIVFRLPSGYLGIVTAIAALALINEFEKKIKK